MSKHKGRQSSDQQEHGGGGHLNNVGTEARAKWFC